jgi:hypothetical protein
MTPNSRAHSKAATRSIHRALAATIGALLVFTSLAGVALAQVPVAAWLDGPPRGWNAAGAAVPAAPAPAGVALPMCRADERPAAGPEEQQVAAAGWRLEGFWPTQRAGQTALVLASADYDGMCRPMAFNGFLFADGRFAGTLAPTPMASRFDGALAGTPTLAPGGASLTASFLRYAPDDPLCCPSRPAARVTYRLEGLSGTPVLVPVAIGPATMQLPRTGGGPTLPVPMAWGIAATALAAMVSATSRIGRGILERRRGRP